MAPSKFLFPIQQKGQTTSLITSTMTFFLAMGKKPGQRSFLAAKKNNRNLEAPLEKTWAQRWMLAGSRSLLREVSLLCQTSMVSSIPLANFINSATQSTSHQRFSNKKKTSPNMLISAHTNHLSNVFAWHKKADTKTLALPTIFNISFSLSHRRFSPDRADP